MADPKLYTVAFDSTDDPAMNSELDRLKEQPMSSDAVVDLCGKHGVWARLIENGELVAEIVPAKERRSRTAK